MYYKGEDVAGLIDVIIPRIDVPHTSFGFKVLRQFQAIGTYVTDTAYSLELARNKLRCLQYLMRKNVPFPSTSFSNTREDFDKIIDSIGGAPVVIKLNEGTEGIGVFLAEDNKSIKNFLRTFQQFDAEIMLQRFIGESAGTDLRCFVVGKEVVASMQREAQDDDFRANVALGGHSSAIEPTEEEKTIALNACDAIGLNIAGVDIIRSDNGPLVIEINSAPDFTGEWGLENISGIDVAEKIIDYAIQGKGEFDKSDKGWLD